MRTARNTAEQVIAYYYGRNSYTRTKNEERYSAEGYKKYKKGYETRFVLRDAAEADELRAALVRTGLRPGRPFAKARQTIVPVYSQAAVNRILAIVDGTENHD